MSENEYDKANFAFGNNWKKFLPNVDEDRVRISLDHMLNVLRLRDLTGRVFMDIGCGSGLHSLAAYRSGAERVVSFDVDIDSVEATLQLWQQAGSPKNWTVLQGSVLDETFINGLEKVDIVYSWGVLHHTGDMWAAIRNAVIPLADEGIYYIALYADEVYQNPSPEFWIDIKRRYNRGSPAEREELEYWYAWERVLKSRALAGENPFAIIADYKRSRGMEFWTDVRDWLGGYPIEFSKVRDVARFLRNEGLDVLDVRSGEGNTEYVFQRLGKRTYWSQYGLHEVEVPKPFRHVKANCYEANVGSTKILLNDRTVRHSTILLMENGVLSGFPNAGLDAISNRGEGRYALEDNRLKFSASDNGDPNAKTYTLKYWEFG